MPPCYPRVLLASLAPCACHNPLLRLHIVVYVSDSDYSIRRRADLDKRLLPGASLITFVAIPILTARERIEYHHAFVIVCLPKVTPHAQHEQH